MGRMLQQRMGDTEALIGRELYTVGRAEAEVVRQTMCTKFEEDMKEKLLNGWGGGGFIHVAKNKNSTPCTTKLWEHRTVS